MEDTIGNILEGVIFLFFSAVVISIFIMCFVNISFTINTEGTHSGYVTAIQKEGVFVKQYHIYFKTDISSSQEDSYCIKASESELVTKLRKTSEKKERITIFYNNKFTTGIWNPECAIDEIYKFN